MNRKTLKYINSEVEKYLKEISMIHNFKNYPQSLKTMDWREATWIWREHQKKKKNPKVLKCYFII